MAGPVRRTAGVGADGLDRARIARAGFAWLALAAIGPVDRAGAGDRGDPPAVASGPVVVRGVVTDPDGRPVAGARVRPGSWDEQLGKCPEATTEVDGRYAIQVPARFDRDGLPNLVRLSQLVATAAGFGPGAGPPFFVECEIDDVSIRLASPGCPIEGWVVDLEGRPVAGARAIVTGLNVPAGGDDLDRWLIRAKATLSRFPWRGMDLVPLRFGSDPISGTADADGRLALPPLGAGRVAVLSISAPGMANAEVHVLTDESDGPIRVGVEPGPAGPASILVRPPRFAIALAPGRPVAGVVRDRDTGRPIAGVRVGGRPYREDRSYVDPSARVTTDAEGRYRLDGMPRADAYRIFALDSPKTGHPGLSLRVAATPGVEPVAFDLEMKRGAVVRGRVTDEATGRPVAGLVRIHPFADNPALSAYPGFGPNSGGYVELDAEGRYEVVAPPGRAILDCVAFDRSYRTVVGGGGIAGYDAGSDSFATVPRLGQATNGHALREVRPTLDATPATVDLRLEPARRFTIDAVVADARPIGDLRVEGRFDAPFSSRSRVRGPSFEATAPDPSRPRRLTVRREADKLVGSLYLRGDESGRITLLLAPWAEIRGRVVDAEGRPRPYLALQDAARPRDRPEEIGLLPRGLPGGRSETDADGRFRVVGLVPGLLHGMDVADDGGVIGGLFRGARPEPGGDHDLGDLAIQPLGRRP